jgi:hypothetical protein
MSYRMLYNPIQIKIDVTYRGQKCTELAKTKYLCCIDRDSNSDLEHKRAWEHGKLEFYP